MYLLHCQSSDGQPSLKLVPADGQNYDVEALPHEALSEYVQPGATIQITLKNARILGEELTPGQTLTASMRIAPEAGEPLFGLVQSGWIPFPFVSGDIALVDRNVVSKIEGLKKISQATARGMPISPHLNLSFAGRLISPLPYVLEGSLRKTQTLGELHRSLARANKALRRVLPDANIHPVDEVRLVGLRGLLQDTARFQKKAIPFLMEVCPSVAQPAGPRQQVEVERKVLRVAKESGLSSRSLVVLAALSCLYDNVSGNIHPKVLKPGRAVLKPKKIYSEGDAYAALSDLLFLEFVVSLKGHGLAQRPVFYTHDIGLAAFWSALSPRKFSHDGEGGAIGNFTLGPSLFPALNYDQCAALLDRLQIRTN